MVKFYGKRGMSCHGTVSFYRRRNEDPSSHPIAWETKENISMIYIYLICAKD